MTEMQNKETETTGEHLLSFATIAAAAVKLGCLPSETITSAVSGGYSHNRRGLIGYNDQWLFAKEIDPTQLAGDGTQERAWLYKDHACTEMIRTIAPEIVAEWSSLSADGQLMLMSSYRHEDGWVWLPPADSSMHEAYVTNVLATITRLATIHPAETQVDQLGLKPYIRDMIAHDSGIDMIISDPEVRRALSVDYQILEQTTEIATIRHAAQGMQVMLNDQSLLLSLRTAQNRLDQQPQLTLSHGDIRADNIVHNAELQQTKLVDFDWLSLAPEGFDTTEFLIDTARYGVDVLPWAELLNKDLLAATVGYYARRAIEDDDDRQSLRNLKLESAAIAAWLYLHV